MTEQNQTEFPSEDTIKNALREYDARNIIVHHRTDDAIVFIQRDETPETEFLNEGETVVAISAIDGEYTVGTGEATGSQSLDASNVVSQHDNIEDAVNNVVDQFNK